MKWAGLDIEAKRIKHQQAWYNTRFRLYRYIGILSHSCKKLKFQATSQAQDCFLILQMYSKLACSCQFDFFWYRRIASSSLPVRTTTLMRAMFLAVNCASMVAKKNKKFAFFSFVSQMYNVFMILSPSRFLQSPDKSRIPPIFFSCFPFPPCHQNNPANYCIIRNI